VRSRAESTQKVLQRRSSGNSARKINYQYELFYITDESFGQIVKGCKVSHASVQYITGRRQLRPRHSEWDVTAQPEVLSALERLLLQGISF
jgi:hypothetical protein